MSIASLEDVDIDRLSAQSKYALKEIAPRMADEGDAQRVAEDLGVSRKEVNNALTMLREEMLAQCHGATLPALRNDDYEALKDSIQRFGQHVPILTYRGQIVDGEHRVRACAELGIEPIAHELAQLDDARGAGLAANTARRQLTPEQRRKIIGAEIMFDPGSSDRSIAAIIGVSPTTVGKVRGDLEKRGMVSRVDTRRGLDGVVQPVAQMPPPVEPEPPEWDQIEVAPLVHELIDALRERNWLHFDRWSPGLQLMLEVEDGKTRLRLRKL